MASHQSNKGLAEINHQFVAKGESLPEVALPDGTKIQTGTVGALLQNIKIYDRLCNGETVEGMFQN